MSTPIGVIRQFVKTLVETDKTGTEAADEAFKAVGAGTYSAFKSAFISEKKSYSSYQDFFEQVCGIRINNTDTGAITGSDAGFSSTAKTAESIIPELDDAKELTDAEYNSFTINGLNVNISYATTTSSKLLKNFDYDEELYLEKQKLVTRALYNWWVAESLDLINESLGISLADGKSSINEINIVFDYRKSNTSTTVETDFSYDMGLASSATIKINANNLYDMTEDDKNGTLPQKSYVYSEVYSHCPQFTNYLDRLILMGLAEVALASNIAYANKLPNEISGGLCALVGGIDDSATNYNSFASGTTGGYAYLRYLAKNYSDGIPSGVSYNAKKTTLTLTTDFEEKTLDLANFDSTVKNVNATALKSGVKIIGNDLNNSLKGGSGDDTLDGGAGNDTLTGGKGNDLFIFSGGNDIITDYAAGDKISVSGAIKKATVEDSDVVLTVGNDSLTVKNGANKTLTIINSAGKENSTVIGGGSNSTLNVTNTTKSPVTVGSSIKIIDASARTADVKITGNTKANTILGGEGNDTIIGGKGADVLTGGDGADIFVYASGDGNDIITDYEEDDIISIASATADVTTSGDNVILTVGSGKITLNGAADKVVTYIDKDGEHTFPENVETYEINAAGTAITLFSNFSDKTFDVADYGSKIVTINASATTRDFEIIGNSKVNKIIGGSGNNTIEGGTKNDTLTGGKGADVFVYYNGEGNDVITDYSSDDKIYVVSGTVKASTKSKDVVFTVGKGKITVKNSLTKGITLIDEDDFEHNYFKGKEVVTKKNSTVTISDKYWKDSFDISNYGNNLKTINASAVTQNLLITGNGKANKILGGEGNDTIIGGKGGDTLYGGDGKDVFIYNKGDGKDIIVDYTAGDDIIKINSGALSDDVVVKDNDVVFTIGEGKVSVQNAADKSITIVDEYGKSSTKIYANNNADIAWFMEDDNNFSDNELSELVETKTYLPPAQLDTSTDLFKENNFVTYSDKK